MSLNRIMDKEAMVHIYNGILFSHKKECIWLSANEMDEPRTYYAEWSQSDRENQISYINPYIYIYIYIYSRKMALMKVFAGQQWKRRWGEQSYGHGVGEGEGGTKGDSSMETYTLPCVK